MGARGDERHCRTVIRVAERSETQLGAHLERHRLSARSLRLRRGSGSAAQRHDRQVLRSGVKIDLQIEFQARLAFDERPWHGTRGPSGPLRSRLEARLAVARVASVINFVRGTTTEGRVRTILVVPVDEGRQFLPKRLPAKRHERQPPQEIGLEREDEPS